MSDPEKRTIYLGTVNLGDGDEESIAFAIPTDATPEKIAAAIEVANKEKAEAQERESRRLREMFLTESAADD
jgi:hypothetical protein